MKVEYKKSCFNRIISRVFILGVFLSILMGPWSALASPQDEAISCGEFIAMMADSQPENPLFPKSHSQLSREELYIQTAQNLSQKGFKVLDRKSFHESLESNEFVQLTYVFAGGSPGRNLFEQKLFLKRAGIINSADVGLTTAYDGKVYQTHQEETVVNQVRLATPIYMYDQLETDLSAKATFTFDDGSTLTMAEGSTINITKHIYDPDTDLRQTIVHLSNGAVRFIVTKGKARGSMFKVITPTATAGVRGTEFVVIVNPSGTTFIVLEGSIETMTRLPGGEVAEIYIVSAGELQNFSKNGKAAKVKKTPPGLLRSTMVRTQRPQNILKQKGLSKAAATNGAKAAALTMAKNKAKQGSDHSFPAAIVKNATQEAVQHATQDAVDNATQVAVQHATQVAVQHATQVAVQHATQVAVQHATQNAVHNATQAAVRAILRDASINNGSSGGPPPGVGGPPPGVGGPPPGVGGPPPGVGGPPPGVGGPPPGP